MIKQLTKNHYRILLVVIAVVLTFLAVTNLTRAAAPTLAVSPTAQNVAKGSTFPVQVRMSSDTPVTAVQANLNYTSNLEVVSISYEGSAFGLGIQDIYGGGNIRMARASLTPVQGNALFATVTFRAIGGGTGLVTFAAGSDIASAIDDSNILGATLSGKYKITGKK